MFQTESIIPLTMNEFMELATAVPDNKLNCDDEIEIVVNQDRAVVRDRNTKLTISWIRRNPRPNLARTG
jgi:hypothetical protein